MYTCMYTPPSRGDESGRNGPDIKRKTQSGKTDYYDPDLTAVLDSFHRSICMVP
jgi:hypothetical protein